jgi:tetratricopeptide (TPR) repeat protein
MKKAACMLCALALSMMLGCGGDGGGGPSKTAASVTAQGWTLFEQGHYEEALGKFWEALSLDDSYADAYNGLGWTHAKLDSLDEALDDFDDAYSAGMRTADLYAGRAPVYRDVIPPRFGNARSSADGALAKDGRYVFSHDTSFDWRDLFLIKAHSFYGLSEFLLAKTMVDSLDRSDVCGAERYGTKSRD